MIRIRDDVLEEQGHSYPENGLPEENQDLETAWRMLWADAAHLFEEET